MTVNIWDIPCDHVLQTKNVKGEEITEKISVMSLAAGIVLTAAVAFSGDISHNSPKASEQVAATFDIYRAAIQEWHGIDITEFRQTLNGGMADNKKVTDFALQQLLMGIEVELEHTNDKFRALEISMDHLTEFPDYYLRLLEMEEEAEKEHGHE